MVQVRPYLLWLGHAGDGRDVQKLADVGIEAVVQLAAEESPVKLLRDMLAFRIPLVDGSGNHLVRLRLAVQIVVQLLKGRVPTLVCCGAGASRSPAIVACALAVSEERRPNECLQLVQSLRDTDVTPGLWHDLLTLYQQDDL